MSAGPETIVLKRKRGDEPLELLYVQNEGKQTQSALGKRRITDNVYRLVRGREKHDGVTEPPLRQKAQRAASANEAPVKKISTFTSFKPDVGSPTGSGGNASSKVAVPNVVLPGNNIQASQSSLRSDTSRAPKSGLFSTKREPRKFLLTKERFSERSSGRFSPQYGVQKRKGASRNGLAVFLEQKISYLRTMASSGQLTGPKLEGTQRVLRESSSQIFKQPSGRKWRSGNLSSQLTRIDRSLSPLPGTRSARRSPNASIHENEIESLQLAASLQQFALETAPAENNAAKPNLTNETPQGVKVSGSEHGFGSRSVRGDEDEDGYIYDHYVRESAAKDDGDNSRMDTTPDLSELMPEDNVTQSHGAEYGLLVIRDEDKDDWEAFADDVDEDEEGYSEDEDSNAEDFYANDYPEAELSSGDEFDDPTAVYRDKSRAQTSDNEYDLANDAHSDDDSYGFSSDGEHKDNWRKIGSHRGAWRVEKMTGSGDESA